MVLGRMARILGCMVESWPLKYLGMSLGVTQSLFLFGTQEWREFKRRGWVRRNLIFHWQVYHLDKNCYVKYANLLHVCLQNAEKCGDFIREMSKVLLLEGEKMIRKIIL